MPYGAEQVFDNVRTERGRERERDFGRNVQHSRSSFWADFEAACHSADVQTGAVRPQCICKKKREKERNALKLSFS